MPMSGTALGTALANAAGSADPPGIFAWQAIGTAFVNWAGSNMTLTPPLSATDGGPVTGTGVVVCANSTDLGDDIAAAAMQGAVDPLGRTPDAWRSIAGALASWIAANGQADPSTLVAAGGVVSGTCSMGFISTAVGTNLASAAGSSDPVGQGAWNSIGNAWLNYIASNAVITAAFTYTSPGPSPCLGVGSVS